MRCVRIALVLAMVTPAAGAGAQEPGVTYDPDSAAGREYEIPLESARRSAGAGSSDKEPRGGSAGGSSAPGTAPLFGVGITPRTASRRDTPQEPAEEGGSATPSPSSPGSSAPGSSSGRSPVPPTDVTAPGAAVAAARNASDEQMRTGLVLLLGGGGVAGAAGAAAMWMRRRPPGADR